jgi:hypothetical protein
MYIAGFFYGAISVAQAYVEALSLFLTEIHHLRKSSDTAHRWTRLREKQVSSAVYEAAIAILTDRNHFHHLNKLVEQDFEKVVSPEVV